MVKGTTYNGTKNCGSCGNAMTPTAVMFAGPSGYCHRCRDKKQSENMKNRMAPK